MHVETSFVRNLGGLIRVRQGMPDRLMKAKARTMSMHADEESDEVVLSRRGGAPTAALVDPNLDLLALEDGPVGLQGWLLTLRSYQAVPSFTGCPFSEKPYPQSTASAVAADAVAAALDELAALAAAEG